MSKRGEIKIVQIIVDVGAEDYCAVALPKGSEDMIIACIAALSDGPIKMVRLPGVKLVPIKDMQP